MEYIMQYIGPWNTSSNRSNTIGIYITQKRRLTDGYDTSLEAYLSSRCCLLTAVGDHYRLSTAIDGEDGLLIARGYATYYNDIPAKHIGVTRTSFPTVLSITR